MRFALALLVVLSGCISLTSPSTPQTEGYTEMELAELFNHTAALELTLADFANDSILLQVLPAEGQAVHLAADGQLAVKEGTSAGGQEVESASPKPCISLYTAAYRYMVFGGLRQPIAIVSAAGQATTVAAPSYDIDYTLDIDTQLSSFAPGVPLTVALAVAEASAWAEDGALSLKLHSDEPFHWRALEGGGLECEPVISTAEGGYAADVGVGMAVRDKQRFIESDGSGLVGLYVGATGSFAASLSGPNGFYQQYQADLNWVFGMGGLPAGTYTLDVAELTGSNVPMGQEIPTAAQILWHDVPDWVLLPPWEMPPV